MMLYYIYKDSAKFISNIDLKLWLTTMFLINKHRNYYFLTNTADLKLDQLVLINLNSNKTDSDKFQLVQSGLCQIRFKLGQTILNDPSQFKQLSTTTVE